MSYLKFRLLLEQKEDIKTTKPIIYTKFLKVWSADLSRWLRLSQEVHKVKTIFTIILTLFAFFSVYICNDGEKAKVTNRQPSSMNQISVTNCTNKCCDL